MLFKYISLGIQILVFNNTNIYLSMLFEKLITLFAEKQLWYRAVQRAQAWLGNAVYPNGNKTSLFNREFIPENLEYLTLKWPVIIIKWKREWKDLSRNMKPCILQAPYTKSEKCPPGCFTKIKIHCGTVNITRQRTGKCSSEW